MVSPNRNKTLTYLQQLGGTGNILIVKALAWSTSCNSLNEPDVVTCKKFWAELSDEACEVLGIGHGKRVQVNEKWFYKNFERNFIDGVKLQVAGYTMAPLFGEENHPVYQADSAIADHENDLAYGQGEQTRYKVTKWKWILYNKLLDKGLPNGCFLLSAISKKKISINAKGTNPTRADKQFKLTIQETVLQYGEKIVNQVRKAKQKGGMARVDYVQGWLPLNKKYQTYTKDTRMQVMSLRAEVNKEKGTVQKYFGLIHKPGVEGFYTRPVELESNWVHQTFKREYLAQVKQSALQEKGAIDENLSRWLQVLTEMITHHQSWKVSRTFFLKWNLSSSQEKEPAWLRPL